MLLAFLFALQDPAVLIERLGSDRVEDRAAAYRELEALGESARAGLERAARDGNEEQRAAARRLLDGADQRRWSLLVRPPPRRFTLPPRKEPLQDARRRLLAPFGLGPESLQIPD